MKSCALVVTQGSRKSYGVEKCVMQKTKERKGPDGI
jgi:hypothetical protein